MALIERVATLLRANIAELVERAEDPEKVLKQLVLDMENQLLQVKTQVAIALTDQHLLEGRAREQEDAVAEWRHAAESAVGKQNDGLARAALRRALDHEETLTALRVQMANQAHEADAVRASYRKLQGKLRETQSRCELLLAEHRRTRLLRRAAEARAASGDAMRADVLERMRTRISSATATAAEQETEPLDEVEVHLQRKERESRVEEQLRGLKRRKDQLHSTSWS